MEEVTPASRKNDTDLLHDSVKGIRPNLGGQLLELVRQLHDAGLVEFTLRCRGKRGVFVVNKNTEAQRLIFDCRPGTELWGWTLFWRPTQPFCSIHPQKVGVSCLREPKAATILKTHPPTAETQMRGWDTARLGHATLFGQGDRANLSFSSTATEPKRRVLPSRPDERFGSIELS